MRYLRREQILFLNQQLVLTYGGYFEASTNNLLHPERLDYLLEVVEASQFGVKLFRNKLQIASAYIFFIIKDHIFLDGNKRTGLNSALLFLALNGVSLNATNNEVEAFALRVLEEDLTKEDIVSWLKLKKI